MVMGMPPIDSDKSVKDKLKSPSFSVPATVTGSVAIRLDTHRL